MRAASERVGYVHENIRPYLPILRIGLPGRRIPIGGRKPGAGRMHRLRQAPGILAGPQTESLSAGHAVGAKVQARLGAALSGPIVSGAITINYRLIQGQQLLLAQSGRRPNIRLFESMVLSLIHI